MQQSSVIGEQSASVEPATAPADSAPAPAPTPATESVPEQTAPVPASEQLDENVQGLHTSLNELLSVQLRARSGNQQHKNIDRVVAIANEGWTFGVVGTRFSGTSGADIYDKQCLKLIDPHMDDIVASAGAKIFALVLSYILTDSIYYAAEAKKIILDFASSSGFDTVEGNRNFTGANQCAFDISLFAPLLIDSALMLEAYPDWTAADKEKVQSWLATEVYPVTSAIARTRLDEVYPAYNSYSPAEAKSEHIQTQLNIIGNKWAGDTRCAKFGFQLHGGSPDELRRGSTGCDGTYLHTNDKAYSYQITTLNHLIYHAEALRRHGDNELYNYKLDSGESLILQGILFVIENQNGTSYDWLTNNLGVLRIANNYFNDPRLCRQLARGYTFNEGRYLPYTKLTYPHVCQ